MKYVFFVIILFIGSGTKLFAAQCAILSELDSMLHASRLIEKDKELRIDKIRAGLNEALTEQRSQSLLELFYEYELFKYDSAFKYAKMLQMEAFNSKDKPAIHASRVKISHILTTKGLFNEALDTIQKIDRAFLSIDDIMYLNKTLVKLYFGLEHYSKDLFYGNLYKSKAIQFIDSVIYAADSASVDYFMYKGLRNLAVWDLQQSIFFYKKVVQKNEVSLHNLAQSYASLGFLYKISGTVDTAVYYLTKAAICDIKGNIKETTALRGLAELLYENAQLYESYKYIQIAKKDAEFYGTQLRILEVSTILAKIEGNYLLKTEMEKARFKRSTYFITIVALLFLLFSSLITIQVYRLQKARKHILESNMKLNELNKSLKEANVIKEEYIGHFFSVSSLYIEKIERLKKSIDNKIAAKQFNELGKTLRKMELKKERELLFKNFDEVFLKLFPTFITEYDKLFESSEEDKDVWKQLTTAQRIFALIRLGITDNEKIGAIFNLSVNTIYTYKTKEKNRSTVSNDEFENCIMKIGSSK